jgi:hypothetical protein
MRFIHTSRRRSGVISSFGGAAFRGGGGGRISGNGREGTLADPEGIETASDGALGVVDVVAPEDVARTVLLVGLRGVDFASCSAGLSREPVCNAIGSGRLLGT